MLISKKSPKSKRNRVLRRVVFGIVGVLLVPALQVAALRFVNPPFTVPVFWRWIVGRAGDKTFVHSQYQWMEMQLVSRNFSTVVWLCEDRRFFDHAGFDWDEIKSAWQDSKESGKPVRGASTITQQCARSLFLWQGRSWIRKGLEAYYTFWMELILSKRRILELYVNVIEFGDGIYGIEAAAQHYYKVPASQLTREQAAMLVAIMPSPKKWDPLNPNERVLQRQKRILENAAYYSLPEGLMK